MVGRAVHMQSLQTPVKREAERLSRRVSVEFDTICLEARSASEAVRLHEAAHEAVQVEVHAGVPILSRADALLAKVPEMVRRAAVRVVEEQIRDPQGWSDTIRRWKDFYTSALTAPMPSPGPQTAIEAQAYLNGIELAEKGQPLTPEYVPHTTGNAAKPELILSEKQHETWQALCTRALNAYRHKVTPERHKLAQSKLPEVKVLGCCTVSDIQEGLREWANARLLEVQPRTVSGQLMCMVSALRCVLPKLSAPLLRQLKGVMQPRVGDRQSMPVQEIRAALQAFRNRLASAKVRKGYGGGASQFDAIAVEVLAVLGMRPRELIQARTNALVTKVDVLGEQGLFLRLVDGKNKASEREIPLNDGTREVVPVQRLREMLEWQEKNPRSIAGAVSSLGTRFKDMTKVYTLYQMRHSWKDLAVHANVDSELRERLMGHKVPGVAAVYGSGIPLSRGLDALFLIRGAILNEKR